MTLVLGIETSCDETAAALVDSNKNLRAQKLASQIRAHAPYGGIVPEVAARAHLAVLEDLVRDALVEAKANWKDIDAIAATTGPGLIGGVIVGATFAKAAGLGTRASVCGCEPSGRPCAVAAFDPTNCPSPICCCWFPAGIANC